MIFLTILFVIWLVVVASFTRVYWIHTRFFKFHHIDPTSDKFDDVSFWKTVFNIRQWSVGQIFK